MRRSVGGDVYDDEPDVQWWTKSKRKCSSLGWRSCCFDDEDLHVENRLHDVCLLGCLE
jgi:hypothetical protein